MIIATIARKPFEGTVLDAVATYGTGSLNVGACRIGTHQSKVQGSGGAKWDSNGMKFGLPLARIDEPRIGRFPANLILVHRPGCVLTGEAKIPVNENGGGKLWSHYRDGKLDQARATPSKIGVDGVETINVWECVEGCPVKALDHQVGIKPGMPLGTGPKTYGGGGGFGGHLNRQPHPGFGDIGFVSRFFKQVQSKSRSE